MTSLIASIRLVAATMLICVAGYTLAILGVAQLFPDTARGSLITAADGKIIGSRLIAQNFTAPRYFWPRPSAAGQEGYDATAAAGSNKSPTSADLTERARELIARYGATAETPLPAELAAASGGGLDPHISVEAASYQAKRVASARELPLSQVEALIGEHAFAPGGLLTPDRLVNVLELNLALDALALMAHAVGVIDGHGTEGGSLRHLHDQRRGVAPSVQS
jgi:potassium-transporting ATPase KdpC subunit